MRTAVRSSPIATAARRPRPITSPTTNAVRWPGSSMTSNQSPPTSVAALPGRYRQAMSRPEASGSPGGSRDRCRISARSCSRRYRRALSIQTAARAASSTASDLVTVPERLAALRTRELHQAHHRVVGDHRHGERGLDEAALFGGDVLGAGGAQGVRAGRVERVVVDGADVDGRGSAGEGRVGDGAGEGDAAQFGAAVGEARAGSRRRPGGPGRGRRWRGRRSRGRRRRGVRGRWSPGRGSCLCGRRPRSEGRDCAARRRLHGLRRGGR